MSKRIFFLLGIPVFIIVIFLIFRKKDADYNQITTQVKRGSFTTLIYSSGQLESEKSVTIEVPDKLKDRNLRIYELAITDMVDEGTVVDSGDYVATLDRQVVEEQLKLAQDEIERTLTELQDGKIDSNLNLSNQRDVIVNARLDVTEKKITMDESIYESPSVQKRSQMDYDKAKRKLEQELKAYQLKKEQEENKVQRRNIAYRQVQDRAGQLQNLYGSLEVRAPKAGIVTYYKYTWGEVVKTGFMVGPYNTIIATIPDMSNLISRTYINEIDISKVKVGQTVKIGIDAFPGKQLNGEVISVANIGQAMPNSDAKVFEVKIKIFEKDSDLKPSMTTANAIQAGAYQDTLMVPTDAIFENDSLKFVYLGADRPVKQIVWLGDENENYVLIKKGIKENDVVWLSEPADAESLKYQGVEIYSEILKEKEEARKKAEQVLEQKQKMQQQPALLSGQAIVGASQMK